MSNSGGPVHALFAVQHEMKLFGTSAPHEGSVHIAPLSQCARQACATNVQDTDGTPAHTRPTLL